MSAYRPDIREDFERAARRMLDFQQTFVVLVSAPLLEQQKDWSEPVQFRFVRKENSGVAEMEIRRVDA